MYFPGTQQGMRGLARLEREVHIVNKLTAQLLVGTDIIAPEQFNFSAENRQLHINSCDTVISIRLENRPERILRRGVYTDKRIVIQPQQRVVIPIRQTTLPAERDFFFKPTSKAITLYSHLVDANFAGVVAENRASEPVTLNKWRHLGSVSELPFDNYYNVEVNPQLAASSTAAADDTALHFYELTRAVDSETPAITVPQSDKMITLENGITIYGHRGSPRLDQLIDALIANAELFTDRGKFANNPPDR